MVVLHVVGLAASLEEQLDSRLGLALRNWISRQGIFVARDLIDLIPLLYCRLTFEG